MTPSTCPATAWSRPARVPASAAWAAALPPGVLLFVDPGPLVAQIPPEVLDPVLARCDWLSCNAREAALLSGVTAPEEAARRLLARTARASVIVRVGPDGCFLATRSAPAAVTRSARTRPHPRARPCARWTRPGPATRTPACSSRPWPTACRPADAARRANAAAALAVTRPGPATSPARAELDAWLARERL